MTDMTEDFTALEALADLLMWIGYDRAADAIYYAIEQRQGAIAD